MLEWPAQTTPDMDAARLGFKDSSGNSPQRQVLLRDVGNPRAMAQVNITAVRERPESP